MTTTLACQLLLASVRLPPLLGPPTRVFAPETFIGASPTTGGAETNDEKPALLTGRATFLINKACKLPESMLHSALTRQGLN